MLALTSFYDFQVKPRSLGVLGVVLSLLWISNPDSARSDTLSIYFPPALEKDTGLQTSTGGSLEGFVVRAGALTGTASQLISNLTGKTTSADILTTINSSFREYSSFSMADAYLSDPDQAIVTLSGSMNNANFKGKDIYLLFYNNATASAANEIGIFRMAIREDNPDGSTGIFPTGNNATGGRESIFNFADPEGVLGPESYLNLLIGQYDSLNNKFTLGDLSGGIGQITSPLNVTNNSGTAFNYQITANNGANRYFATTNTSSPDLLTTTLPSWASVNTNTGVINFTTNSVSGNYTIRLVASNSLTASVATNTLNLALKATTLTFSTTTNQITATAGVAITPFTFVATPGTNSYSVATGDLFGLTLSTNGTLYGIPNSAGTNNVSVRASSGDRSATTTFNLAVASPTISVPSGELTSAGQILTTAGTSRTIPINKPDGFTSLTGRVTANPTYTGVSFNGENLVVNASAPPLPKGTDHVDLILTSSRLVDGSPVSASTTVPLRIVAPVPTNLRFIESFTDANANQVYDLGETYVDSVFNGNYDSSIASSSLEVFVCEAYSIYFSTSASGVCPLEDFSVVSGALPPGLLLQSVGGRGGNRIYGTNTSTTAPSDYTVTLKADTSRFYEGGGPLTSTFTLRLRNRNAPYFYPLTSRLLGAQGKYLKYNLSAFNSPFKYEAANLPSWLSLKSNQGQWVLEGTPTSAGIFSIPVTAYNAFRPGSTSPSDLQPGYGTLIIHIASSRANVTLTGANNLKVGVGASFYLVPGGAEGAGVRVNVTGLPPGLVVNRTTSQVTGTPTAKGTYPMVIYVQNGKGFVKQAMTLTVGQ